MAIQRSSRIHLIGLCIGVLAIACDDGKGGAADTGGVGGEPTDTSLPIDGDGDGYAEADDCDDGDATVNPGATEVCDGVDNNCDDEIDEGVTETFYADADSDGFGDLGAPNDLCEPMDGWVPNDEDCDDTDGQIYPGQVELCDGIDNDCDIDIDEDLEAVEWFLDADSDGYGDPTSSILTCDEPSGYVANDLDCDDSDWLEPVHVSASGGVPGGGGGGGDTSDTWFGLDSADSGVTGDGSAANPFSTIQAGINAASVCVHVFNGTYLENIDFNGKDITVEGIDGVSSTTISGVGGGPTVTFANGESADAHLTGFTITGGTGDSNASATTSECGSGLECTVVERTIVGGGVYVEGASPTLSSLHVLDNALPAYSYRQVSATEEIYIYSFGGGMYVSNGSPTVRSVVFEGNAADAGGGLYADSSSNVNLTWTLFDGNLASSGGGIGSEGNATLTNGILVNNIATSGGSSVGGAAVDVADGLLYAQNVTASGNDGLGTVYIGAAASATLANVVAVENSGGYVIDGESGAALTISYSDVWNSGGSGSYSSTFADPTGADGNISGDPIFVLWSDDDAYGNDDLHLAAGSPGIDAGSPVAAYDDADGTQNDMGAYGGPYGDW